MNYYTSQIPPTLAEKLKEKGMPMITSVSISIVEDKPVVDENGEQWYRPSYAEVFDWMLSEKDMFIDVHPSWETGKVTYKSAALPDDINAAYYPFSADTWHEAAEKAIEKALELI